MKADVELLARRNYARFLDVSEDACCVSALARSLGGLEAWASLSGSSQPSAVDRLQRSSHQMKLEIDLLRDLADKNHRRFEGLPLPEASDEREVLKWSLPSLAIAKEGYEKFNGYCAGEASLARMLSSSAGVQGWEAFARHTKSAAPKAPGSLAFDPSDDDSSETDLESSCLNLTSSDEE